MTTENKTASVAEKFNSKKAPAAKVAPKAPAAKPATKKVAKPAAKKAAPKKPAAKKAPAATRERVSADAKIKVLAKENPHRGALAAKTFDLYKKAKTVGEWRDLCRKNKADPGYLHADIAAGFISVSE